MALPTLPLSSRTALRIAVAVALLAGAFFLGRATADTDDGRAAGVREGRAQGVREGRALQQPAAARSAFKAGYEAGANDVFGGYDGGWDLGRPYVVTLARGSGGITYRIDSRR